MDKIDLLFSFQNGPSSPYCQADNLCQNGVFFSQNFCNTTYQNKQQAADVIICATVFHNDDF